MASENAYAARIDDDGVVREIIVIPYCGDDDATITEFCNSIGLNGIWIDTSYTGARRKRPAGIGYRYDRGLDEFLAPTQLEESPSE